jgi:putative FmdB family regulatory protein
MPTYEYRCRKCKKTFDKLQSMSEKPISKCLLCGAAKPERLIGAGAGLIFKGSGFYITDYKNKSSSFTSDKAAGEKGAPEKSSAEKSPAEKSPAPKEAKKSAPPAKKSGKE